MITKELINTQLGAILAELGKPVCNAAQWQEELGDNAPTEAAILAKKAEIDARVSAVAAGFDTTLGYSLSVGENDQNAFARLIVGLQTLGVPDNFMVDIKGSDGAMYFLDYATFKNVMKGYTTYCYGLWKS